MRAVVGHLTLLMQQGEIGEEQHRIVVADGGLEQALDVRRSRRHHHLQARRMREHRFQVVVVLRADAPAAAGHAQGDQRELELPAGQVAQLAGAVDQRVHRIGEKGREQQIDHRPQAAGGRAHRGAGDDSLGQRGVAHARRAKSLHEVAALGGHAFAHQEHAFVALHFLGERLVDRLFDRHAGHEWAPCSAYT